MWSFGPERVYLLDKPNMRIVSLAVSVASPYSLAFG